MRPLRILSVCTQNRTRSVLVGGLLTHHLRTAGVADAVRTAGFGEPGLPPTHQTLRYLQAVGVDVSDHRSHRVSEEDVELADLIVTAERMHVVEIAGRWPHTFAKTFTLPELVTRAATFEKATFDDPASWIDAVGAGRDHTSYLDDEVGEIADPTGQSPAVWRACAATIDTLTAELAHLLVTTAAAGR